MKLTFSVAILVVFCLLSLRPALARTWTDASGTHKIEADFVILEGEIVHLKKPDGAIIKIPLSKLCEDDRKFIQQLSAPGATSGKVPLDLSASSTDKGEKKPAGEIGLDEVIASDDHRSRVDKKQHLSPEYVLRSSRPQQLSHTSIRYRGSCRAGWTTSGDVEASLDGGTWAKIGSWTTATIDAARSNSDWQTVSIRDVQSKSQATEIRVRFVQRGGDHSLGVYEVVWKPNLAQVVGEQGSDASPATSQPASPQDAPSKTAIGPAPEKQRSGNVAGNPDSEASPASNQSASTQDIPAKAATGQAPKKQQDKLLAAKQKQLEQLQKDLERLKNAPVPRGQSSAQHKNVRAKRLEELQGQIAKVQEEIEAAEAKTSDTDSSRSGDAKFIAGADLSEALVPVEIDPVVANLLKPSSDVYDKPGFKEYKFNATTKEVQAITPFKPLPNDNWVGADSTGFFFVNGQLKGIRRAYLRNNEAYVKELVNLFGKADEDNVLTFAHDNWSQTLACHRFPACFVYISVCTGGLAGQSVYLSLYDRKYLTSLLNRDVKAKRKVLVAVERVASVCSDDDFDWKKLPTFGDAAGEVGELSAAVDSSRLVKGKAMVVRGKKGESLDTDITGYFQPAGKASSKQPTRLADALFFVAKTNQEIWIVVNGKCIPGYEAAFLLSNDPANRSQPIKHDVVRCNSALAQELFPPMGDTINVRASAITHDINGYNWKTKDGWTVVVCPNDKFYIYRSLRTKL